MCSVRIHFISCICGCDKIFNPYYSPLYKLHFEIPAAQIRCGYCLWTKNMKRKIPQISTKPPTHDIQLFLDCISEEALLTLNSSPVLQSCQRCKPLKSVCVCVCVLKDL